MKKRIWSTAVSFLLIVSMVLPLAGCGKQASENAISEASSQSEKTVVLGENIDQEVSSEESGSESGAGEEQADTTDAESIESAELSEEERIQIEQRNSFTMMYYLAITAEEILTMKDNRVALEDISVSLRNDINPSSIDERTQTQLQDLRDTIGSFLNISTKRDRLQYLYNQSKAEAVRNAVPNPLAVLSVSNATDWRKLAVSVVYTAVDSYNNYKSANASADKEFLMSGWELDDEEVATIKKNRDDAFDYMVDMVQEYNLDGLKTLNEEAVAKFAEICDIKSVPEKIARFEAEIDTYEFLGNYWLELASCYFENSQYDKCLESVAMYREVSSDIFRKDYNLVQVLPKAIVAAQQVYSGDQYVTEIEKFADTIIENTNISEDDWSTRYFAAQTYLDLYAKTNKDEYLEKAYKIAYDNMNVLLQGQRDLNEAYLSDVEDSYVTVEEPDYDYMTEDEKKESEKEYKEEKKKADAYNKALKKARKTALPSLYEPLVVNCELLFALADEMGISVEEKDNIEAILGTDTNDIFMTRLINDAFSFTRRGENYSIELTKKQIIIPADLLTENATVSVTVTENGSTEIFDDCKVDKVERDGETIDTFTAYVSSKKMSKYEWTSDSKVTVTITYADAYDKSITFDFAVSNCDEHWYGDKVEFIAE